MVTWTNTYDSYAIAGLGQSLIYGLKQGGLDWVVPNMRPPEINKRVLFFNYAVSGSSIMEETGEALFWTATGGAALSTLGQNAIDSISQQLGVNDLTDADLKYVLWDLGNTDASKIYAGTITKAQFKERTLFVFSKIHERFPNAIILLEPATNDQNVSIQGGWKLMVEALLEILETPPSHVQKLIEAYDIDHHDGVHPTNPAGWTLKGQRVARRVITLANGSPEVGTLGSNVISVTGSGTDTWIATIEHDAGDDLVLPNGDPKYVFGALDNGTELTISSVARLSATQLQINLSAASSGTFEELRTGYAAMKGLTYADKAVVMDDATYPLPLNKGSVDVFNQALYDIEGRVFWYETYDTSKITDTSGLVDAWRDRFTDAALTQSGVARPTTGSAMGSYNALLFSGGQYFDTGYKIGTNQFLISGVLRKSAGDRALCGHQEGNHRAMIRFNANNTILGGVGSASASSAATFTDGVDYIVALHAKGSTFDLYVDGVKVITDQAYSYTGTSTANFFIGGRSLSGTATDRLNSLASACVLYTGLKTTADINLICNDLQRYGGTWADI